MTTNVGCMTLTKKARNSGSDQRSPAVLSRYAPISGAGCAEQDRRFVRFGLSVWLHSGLHERQKPPVKEGRRFRFVYGLVVSGQGFEP